MKELVTGVCEFCGQTKSIEVPEGAPEEYANKIVTEKCYCDGAAKHRLKRQTLHNVNLIFGQECTGTFKPVDEDELDYIIKSVDALVEDVVSKVTMSLKSGGSCKLKYTDITCIEVLREEKHIARRSN